MLLAAASSAAAAETIVLEGTITRADHQTYLEAPFEVPPGAEAVTVRFSHTGREQRTTIDLGLRDPQRVRGWSGGNKAEFTLSETEATPSYLAGPLPPGRWALILGVPNIRDGVRAAWRAEIRVRRAGEPFEGFAPMPLKPGPGWYRGDLHAHSAHSDGQCATQSSARAPCPAYRTVEAAAAAGLDFVALTEHNTPSHHAALRELQPAFDRLALLPGREITSFQGHFNVVGPVAPLPFRVGAGGVAMNEALTAARRAGGFVVVNHPATPSGEMCMGCGWTAADTDWSKVDAIEVVNGGALALTGRADGPLSGIPFWHARLNEGHRLIAVAASDNHDALTRDRAAAIGRPATVVWASDLSQPALIAGFRAGRVAIDVDGAGRSLDLIVTRGDQLATMGGRLCHGPGAIDIAVDVAGVPSGTIEIIADGAVVLSVPVDRGPARVRLPEREPPNWLRADVRHPDGRLVVIGNPVLFARCGPQRASTTE